MNDATVSGLYQRYKSGTKHVTQWLLDTARKHCDLTTVLSVSSLRALHTQHPQPSPKKKSKKKGTAIPNDLVLKTQDLVQLAEAVAEAAGRLNERLSGLDAALAVLRDVIAGRTECCAWYSAENAADDGHKHFVLVLKQVRDNLERASFRNKRAECGRKSASAQFHAISSSMINGFSALSVEDTASDEREAATTSTATKATHNPRPEVNVRLEETEEDGIFALWCYFKECNDLRTLISNVWKQYLDGDVSLLVAGQVTDVAFSLIQEGGKKLSDDFPRFATFDAVAKDLGVTFSDSGDRHCFSDKSISRMSGIDGASHAAELLCLRSFTFLSVWRMLLEDDVDEDCYGQLQGLHSFGTAIMSHMSEFRVLGRCGNLRDDLLGCDVYTRELLAFLRSRTVTLSFLVETQIYMDIYQHNKETMGHTAWLTRAIADHLRTWYLQIEHQAKDSPQLRSFCESRQSAHGLNVPENIKRVIGDALIGSEPGLVHVEMSIWQQVFGRFPVLGGVYLAKLAHAKRVDGIQLSNIEARLVSVAHLYSACKRCGALDVAWPDMEHVIQQHRAKLGLRDLPKATATPGAAERRFALALGGKLEEHAGKRRKKRTGAPARDAVPRRVKDSSLEASSASTQMLLKTVHGVGTATMPSSSYDLHELAKRLLDDDPQRVEHRIKEQWNETRALTPAQLLSVFKASIIRDEPEIMFDYHQHVFHWTELVSDLLKLAPDMRPSIEERTALGDTPETAIHIIVDEILWRDAVDEATPAYRRPKKGLLERVAPLVKFFAEHLGDDCVSKARELCSGSLIARYRPCENYDESVVEHAAGDAKDADKKSEVEDPAKDADSKVEVEGLAKGADNTVEVKDPEAPSIPHQDGNIVFGQPTGLVFPFALRALGVAPRKEK